MITLERWTTFTTRDQIGHIGAEILRASAAPKGNTEMRYQILKKALFLIAYSLQDPKWQKDEAQLQFLRDELAKAYIGEEVDLRRLYDAL